ncbi:MAG: circadian clock protein KaiB [Chloroflexi bacterium]|nr:circadian clock protein KaiB [Chloroflexota bacterium]
MNKLVLRLYVAGATPRSERAVANIRAVCADLTTDYDLEVIDVTQQPDVAERERIMATPALVRESPLPRRRIIGDMSQHQLVIQALDLPALPPPPPIE